MKFPELSKDVLDLMWLKVDKSHATVLLYYNL